MRRRDFLATSLGVLAMRLPAAELQKFKLGVITDEVYPDLEPALQWTKDFGLSWAELRMVGPKYVTDLGPDEVKRSQDLLAKFGMKVSVLDTAYFKVTLPGTESKHAPRPRADGKGETYDTQKALLERAIGRAKDFGTDKIRIFAFWRVEDPKSVFDRVARELENTAAICKKEGIRIVLENEPACNVATAPESVAMLNVVKDSNFGLNWDPGNAWEVGEHDAIPDGYKMLDKKRIWHMHLKDCQMNDAGRAVWRPVGGGSMDYVAQFRDLLKDGYTGTMSLETHYRNAAGNKEQSSRESMDGILAAIKKA